MPKRVDVVSVERVFDGFLKIDAVTHTHERFDGADSPPLTRLVVERGDSAAALVHDVERDEVVLVEQFRIATRAHGSGWLAELAAGAIDRGEAPEAAMRRELREELGYRVRRLARIGVFYLSPGGSSERIHLFCARVRPEMLVDPDASGLAREEEDIRALRLPRARFLRLAREGALRDAKTMIAAQWLAARPRPRPPARRRG